MRQTAYLMSQLTVHVMRKKSAYRTIHLSLYLQSLSFKNNRPPHSIKKCQCCDELFSWPIVILRCLKCFCVLFSATAAARTRATGRTESGTAWAWNREAAGSTEANGRKALRAATECASLWLRRPSTTVRGPTDCRMVTDRRLTPMEVRAVRRQRTFSLYFLIVTVEKTS